MERVKKCKEQGSLVRRVPSFPRSLSLVLSVYGGSSGRRGLRFWNVFLVRFYGYQYPLPRRTGARRTHLYPHRETNGSRVRVVDVLWK